MAEGIVWGDIGTVDVTFDDKTYHLGRPKFRQFKYFSEKLSVLHADLVTSLEQIQEETRQAEEKFKDDENSPEARAELKRLKDAMRDLNSTPYYERTIGILAEMFAQVGDPLPEDPDDWPAWLAADGTLPGEILKHWRTNPKASGAPAPS